MEKKVRQNTRRRTQSGIYYMGKGCDIYPSTHALHTHAHTHIQVDRQKCVDFSIESEKLDDFVWVDLCDCVRLWLWIKAAI